jgi:hypothetical protein
MGVWPLSRNEFCRVDAQTLSVMQQQSGDEEAFEYNSLLRHGIFEAYSGILNGMSQPKCDQFLRPFVPVRPLVRQPTCLRSCISLIGAVEALSTWPPSSLNRVPYAC